MGYPTTGSEGRVASWGSANFYSVLLSKITPAGFTIDLSKDEHDITGMNVAAAAMLPGLGNWSASISALALATPRLGNVGTVVWSSGGYALHVESWEWTITAGAVHDITEMAAVPASGPVWRAFRPDGPVKVTGRVNCRTDSATALTALALPTDAAATLTLLYADEATDDQVSGSAYLTKLGVNQRKGSLTTAQYSFVGSGAWTPAGTNSPLGSAALGVPLWNQGSGTPGAIVFDTLASSTRTLTGSDSFWKSITIRCAVGAPVELNVEVQGTGSLTPA